MAPSPTDEAVWTESEPKVGPKGFDAEQAGSRKDPSNSLGAGAVLI